MPPCKHAICISCFLEIMDGPYKSCFVCASSYKKVDETDEYFPYAQSTLGMDVIPNGNNAYAQSTFDELVDSEEEPAYKFDEDVEWTLFSPAYIAKTFRQPSLAESCFQEAKFADENGYLNKNDSDGRRDKQIIGPEDVYFCYKNAAILGHPEAALKEGNMSLEGRGTKQSVPYAANCYRKSASLGNKDAIETLIWLFRSPKFSKHLIPSHISHENKAIMWEKRLATIV